METRKILRYGSAGFFQGFCLFSTNSFTNPNKAFSQKNIGEITASSALGGGLFLMMVNDYDFSILLPYTLGIMGGAISSALFLNGIQALEPTALNMVV